MKLINNVTDIRQLTHPTLPWMTPWHCSVSLWEQILSVGGQELITPRWTSQPSYWPSRTGTSCTGAPSVSTKIMMRNCWLRSRGLCWDLIITRIAMREESKPTSASVCCHSGLSLMLLRNSCSSSTKDCWWGLLIFLLKGKLLNGFTLDLLSSNDPWY